MSNGPTAPALVVLVFPDRAADVARLMATSEHFQSLCEDYELAVETLRGLEERNQAQDAKRLIEYRQLVADLERELEEWLVGGTK